MAKKLDSDTAPKSGRGSDQDRLSDSPPAIRRGNADPVDIDPSPVTSKTGDLGYDDNPRQPGSTDPWKEPGSGETAP